MYAAQVTNGVVQRVIVAPSVEWCVEHLGGEWVETADPYSAEPQEVRYCGPGHGCDPTFPERFAPPWKQPEGAHDALPKGTLVWHEGRIWRSTTDANVWEPGVSGWHDSPEDPNVVPMWVQPTGAHDAYPLGARVTHKGQVWENTGSSANVWEPGVFGWTITIA